MKVVLPGGAGLVGQNLLTQFDVSKFDQIVVIDKHRHNLGILRQLHPNVITVEADLAEPGDWRNHFHDTDVAIILQAQIGDKHSDSFLRNNIQATENVLEAIKRHQVTYTVHVSSSVVESVADDDYTRTKRAQEELVRDSGVDSVILRPTLMFGWFDRKHLGWLSRFMQRVPVFPVPGHGRYMRQPLYARDFCRIILSCIDSRISGRTFDISGREQVDYIDILRTIKTATGARSWILPIPYWLFYALLWTWGLFDHNPPFTTDQLSALRANDEFDVIDWPALFGVKSTPFNEAIEETFNHPRYSTVILEF
jgi:nucleoside-diphosphate-sugar epimerase